MAFVPILTLKVPLQASVHKPVSLRFTSYLGDKAFCRVGFVRQALPIGTKTLEDSRSLPPFSVPALYDSCLPQSVLIREKSLINRD